MPTVEKRSLGEGGPEVTFFGFGALEIGRNWGLGEGAEVQRPDDAEAGRVLNAVLDLGVNLIDTASAYHASEARIGQSISSRRNEYVLATKCGEHSDEPRTYYDFSYRAISESIDRSLELLQTDCVDLLQIHFGPDPNRVLDDGETVRAMKDAREAGKVKLLGASIDGEVARRCIDSGDFDVMQIGYSLLNRSDERLIELCGQKGIGVLIRSGLGAGRLTRRVLSHLNDLDEETRTRISAWLDLVDGDADLLTAMALRFLNRNPHITSVLVGSKSIDHLQRNMELLQIDLSDDLLERAVAVV